MNETINKYLSENISTGNQHMMIGYVQKFVLKYISEGTRKNASDSMTLLELQDRVKKLSVPLFDVDERERESK